MLCTRGSNGHFATTTMLMGVYWHHAAWLLVAGSASYFSMLSRAHLEHCAPYTIIARNMKPVEFSVQRRWRTRHKTPSRRCGRQFECAISDGDRASPLRGSFICRQPVGVGSFSVVFQPPRPSFVFFLLPAFLGLVPIRLLFGQTDFSSTTRRRTTFAVSL